MNNSGIGTGSGNNDFLGGSEELKHRRSGRLADKKKRALEKAKTKGAKRRKGNDGNSIPAGGKNLDLKKRKMEKAESPSVAFRKAREKVLAEAKGYLACAKNLYKEKKWEDAYAAVDLGIEALDAGGESRKKYSDFNISIKGDDCEEVIQVAEIITEIAEKKSLLKAELYLVGAKVLMRQGKFDEAEEALEKGLGMLEGHKGQNVLKAKLLRVKASILGTQGKWGLSEKTAKEGIDLLAFRDDNDFIKVKLYSLCDLALCGQGKVRKAARANSMAGAINKAANWRKRQNAVAKSNLEKKRVNELFDQEKYLEAAKAAEAGIKALAGIAGTKVLKAQLFSKKANMLNWQGKYTDAEEAARKGLEELGEISGQNVLKAELCGGVGYAIRYGRPKKINDIISLAKKGIDSLEKVRGNQTLKGELQLYYAYGLNRQKKYKEAEAAARAGRNALRGLDGFNILNAKILLEYTEALCGRGKFKRAIEYTKKGLALVDEGSVFAKDLLKIQKEATTKQEKRKEKETVRPATHARNLTTGESVPMPRSGRGSVNPGPSSVKGDEQQARPVTVSELYQILRDWQPQPVAPVPVQQNGQLRPVNYALDLSTGKMVPIPFVGGGPMQPAPSRAQNWQLMPPTMPVRNPTARQMMPMPRNVQPRSNTQQGGPGQDGKR